MNWKKLISLAICTLFSLIFFCEFLIYYVTLIKCKWPEIDNSNGDPVKALILADTHLLGPHKGHWFDKLRREWQMHRAFQTAMTLFQPEVVFILGDLFDEGHYVSNENFQDYLFRFHKLFHTPKDVQVISIVGNHDVGFHYRMHPYFVDRFEDNFGNTGVNLYTIKNVHFVVINSMAMEDDRCYFCEIARKDLIGISSTLSCAKNPDKCKRMKKKNIPYSQPIIMQHFPTFRQSDKICTERDTDQIEKYRENWEVLSKEATLLLGRQLEPRLVFSGHSHNYCRTKNMLNIEEYTLASFNWRNKDNPSFVLAKFTPDNYIVNLCNMPVESTVTFIYITAIIGILILINFYARKYFFLRQNKNE